MEEPRIVLPDWQRYVVVEGVIGVGKTSLARLLAGRYDGQLVLEEFEENAFLARFYDDPERWAFQTQLAFLASRFRQQKKLEARSLFHTVTVADYAFEKDRIFAHETLNGDELQLYETLFALMQPTTPAPDLVIYLRAPLERLLENIRRRARSYEQEMDPDYLRRLAEAYEFYFRRYQRAPVRVLDVEGLDYVHREADAQAVLRAIAETPREGITYAQPATQLSS